jgi:hypothetical protein
MGWKEAETVERSTVDAKVLQLLGESASLSRFELVDLILYRQIKRATRQNFTMLNASLRSLERRKLITFDGRYRLETREGGLDRCEKEAINQNC